LTHVARGSGSVLFWWRYDTLCTSGFVDDVIVAVLLIWPSVGRTTQEVTGSSTGPAIPLSCTNLGQVVYTHVAKQYDLVGDDLLGR